MFSNGFVVELVWQHPGLPNEMNFGMKQALVQDHIFSHTSLYKPPLRRPIAVS